MEIKERNQSVDLVKIIAMMGVMALHTCLGRTDSLPGFMLSRSFGLSIPLFFMVSGYLMQGRKIDWRYSVRKVVGILRFTFIICISYWIVHSMRHGVDCIGFAKLWIGSFVQRGQFGVFWYFGAMILLYLILPFYNRWEQQNPSFLPRMIICLLGVAFCFFMADYTNDFENKFIPQTFSLWYWLLFFSVGQLSRKMIRGGQKPFSFALIPVCYIVFLPFVWLSRGYQSCIAYFFGSFLMILYATSVFGSIVQTKVGKSALVQQLSNCFLPVYALHNFVIAFVLKINITSVLGVYAVWADYLLVASITLTLSWLLMKIPYLDKVFKI